MTIITIRDGIMVVDSWINRDDSIIGTIKKWRAVPKEYGGGFITGSGETWFITGFMDEYIKKGRCEKTGNAVFLHLKADGLVQTHNDGWFQYHAGYYAEGAGRQEAMGAMAHGASAEEAAKIVCSFVDGCGGPLHVLEISE